MLMSWRVCVIGVSIDEYAGVGGLRPRWCLHSLATFECCDEIEEASIVSGELVVSCGDAAEVFDLAKEALDQIAILVDRGIKCVPSCCRRECIQSPRLGSTP